MKKDDEFIDLPEPVTAKHEVVAVQKTAVQRTIEAWGEDKGLWPLFRQGSTRGNPESWKFSAAKTWCKWADGQLVTEAEFDKGVADATSQTQR